ncbi:dihydrolipoamide acetyltransferase [Skeletonema marinoi]|uniref:Dihydrolipoamide acetyltransferase n=1 Tax=Skeletonema marinoi TaxID=267567 RepID=A0AAD9D3M6_9STRA|nr:dihydrolipoamide acetyltransferase [Skeletonema marinoi]
MISSSTRRLLISSSTRRSASRQRGVVVSCTTSKRCFVSLTQQSQPSSLSWSSNNQTHQEHPQSSLRLDRSSSLTTQQQRWMSSADDLPYHIVVGMPALSPTMTSGSISKWNVSVGDTFIAGDSLAVIETDKATMDFEAQDDGVVAKILVEEGGGEVECGLPIMVTVEEEEEVPAFANFVPDDAAGGAPAVAESAPAPAAAPATPAADLPYHIVVGMPALSPTMEAGTISKWNVAEGESFVAGDSLAVIETDKATMDFEAQDDGVVGKIMVEAGAGEVTVGVPIMVTVEEEEDVAAFKDFVAGSAPDTSATEASVAPVEEVKAPEPVVAAAAPTPAPAAPTPVAAEPAVAAAAPTPVQGAVSLGGSSWGQLAAESSPLARALASKQKEYIEKYGSTGHVPIV